MKIIAVDIQNQKIIRAFHAKLDGKNLIVSGDTGTGKTTVISALWNILKKGSDQITHGEKEGSISVTLSDGSKTLICSRRYTPSSSQINIVDSEGKKLSVKDVDKMLSDLSVNPHKIAEMKPKERVNTLLKSVSGDYDVQEKLEKLDKEIKEAEEERLYYYRQKKELDPGEEPEKADKVDVNEVIAKIEEAQKNNKEIEELKEDVQDFEEEIESNRLRLEEIKKEFEERKEDIESYKKSIKKVEKELSEKKEIPVSDLKKRLEEAEEINEKASVYQAWKERAEQAKLAEENHKEFETKIKEYRAVKKEELESVQFPLEGLTIKEGELYYRDSLFENLGMSEQMLVCSALAKEQIGKIRVVRLDGIESMSKQDFETLKKLFEDSDIQILASRVSRGDSEPEEITIEEGVYEDEKASKRSKENID